MKKIKFLSLLAFTSITLSGCYVDLGFIKFGKKTEQEDEETELYDVAKDNQEIESYYSGISSSLSGTQLLSALKTLNLGKRKEQVGYEAMSTSSTGKFKFTDYDLASAKLNSNGIPYGTRISSFYSGKVTSSFNREHVWPKSRGGDKVEDDIFMVRPTVTEENSDRGNSCYITGMVDEHNGWDPVAAFSKTIGVAENVRGECARIIFYCMTAADGLVLNDVVGNNQNNMGSLTDMVEWACQNPVTKREKRRNVGGQYLQGNRNAFVDHPEYVCKIWGDYNSTTQAACRKANYAIG